MTQTVPRRGNNRADDPNRSEGGAVGLMTQTVLRRGAIGLMTLIALGSLPSNSLSRAPPAEVQPQLIQGIRRRDSIGDLSKY